MTCPISLPNVIRLALGTASVAGLLARFAPMERDALLKLYRDAATTLSTRLTPAASR